MVLREVRKPPDAIPRCSEIPCRASPVDLRDGRGEESV